MKLKVEEKKIINLAEGKELIFDFSIEQVVEIDDGALIRLEPDIGKIYNENVFRISLVPEIVWQVESIQKLDDDSPYTNIVIKDGKLFLYSWSGERMEINPKNGAVISKAFTK